MRTIKRISLALNRGKWERIQSVAKAYAREKDSWLLELSPVPHVSDLKSDRLMRDRNVAVGYQSAFGLQARSWKLALKDAVETLDRDWQSLFADLRPLIHQNPHLDEDQKRYCFWILQDYERLQGLLLRRFPLPTHFKISLQAIKQATRYLNRTIRSHKRRSPRVKQSRSFCVDSAMYRVFEEKDRQYVAISTLDKGKRVVVPLSGKTSISGNLRVVLFPDTHKVEIHQCAEVQPLHKPTAGTEEAIDFGYTEVATSSQGKTYGAGFGKQLSNYSAQLNEKGKKRNKLRAVAKKSQEKEDKSKTKRIHKNNLGRAKQKKWKRKMQATLKQGINQAFNEFFKENLPAILVVESLRHLFSFNHPPSVNRRLSLWTKGVLQERAEFKAQVGGSDLKQVNAAYSSQTCPHCGFVWSKNRKGDKFKCLFCRHEAQSDTVAAQNLLARGHDPQINLFMPYRRVKELLVERFHRRVEGWDFRFQPTTANLEALTWLGLKPPPLFRAGLEIPSSPDVSDYQEDPQGRQRNGQSKSETK